MSYEPAIDCCALCAAVGVTAVGYMQQSVMFLECKVLMSTIKPPQKFVTCPQVQACSPVWIYSASDVAVCVSVDVNL